MATALEDIAAERKRQIEVEGWTAEHDDEHSDGSIAFAAACYAMSGGVAEVDRGKNLQHLAVLQFLWPRSLDWRWNPKDRRRDLVRAGALIAAEIERIDRASSPTP